MDTIYQGELTSLGGRVRAWADCMLVDAGVFRLVWTNFAVVVPGQLYRSNHPPPWRLASMARRYGLRTIVNLRGMCRNGSDALSRAQAARLGLGFIDAPLSSGRAPRRDQLLALVAALSTAPRPILVHCKSGADRAGFAAALYLVLHGETVAAAMRQLSLRFGHMRSSRTGMMDALLRRYSREAEGRKPFVAWVREDYDQAALATEFRPTGLSARLADFITHRLLRRE